MLPPYGFPAAMDMMPNTAFAIVQELYDRLPQLMNLRDMLYALDKNPDFFSNAFKSTDYYGISFPDEYLTYLGYERNPKDLQILATHIEGDGSYTRFFYKDLVQVPEVTLYNTFLLPKTRTVSKFVVYSKDRSESITVDVDSSKNVYVLDSTGVVSSYSINTEQSFLEILPAWNSCRVTGGGSGGVTVDDTLWETVEDTFVPWYITFSDIPKAVADLCYVRIGSDYNTKHPLYWVSGTTYAIYSPYEAMGIKNYGFDDNRENYEDHTAYNNPQYSLYLPAHFETMNNNRYWFDASQSTDLFANNGEHEVDGNHFVVSSGISNSSDQYTLDQSRYFQVDDVYVDNTEFIFRSVKPKENRQIYLGVNA